MLEPTSTENTIKVRLDKTLLDNSYVERYFNSLAENDPDGNTPEIMGVVRWSKYENYKEGTLVVYDNEVFIRDRTDLERGEDERRSTPAYRYERISEEELKNMFPKEPPKPHSTGCTCSCCRMGAMDLGGKTKPNEPVWHKVVTTTERIIHTFKNPKEGTGWKMLFSTVKTGKDYNMGPYVFLDAFNQSVDINL